MFICILKGFGSFLLVANKSGQKWFRGSVFTFPRAGPPDHFVPGNRTLEDVQSCLMVLSKDHGGLAVQVGQQMLNQLSRLPELPLCVLRRHFRVLGFPDKTLESTGPAD